MILKGIDREFKVLTQKQKELTKKEAETKTAKLVQDLRAATPIDTGLARRSWSLKSFGEAFLIKNDTPYIQYLNQGTSQQAPAFFVEAVALRYGKPRGTIVDVLQD